MPFVFVDMDNKAGPNSSGEDDGHQDIQEIEEENNDPTETHSTHVDVTCQDLANIPIVFVNSINSNEERTEQIIPTYNRQSAFYGLTEFLHKAEDFPKDFDLKTLLTLSPNGAQVLSYYREKETLTDSYRNKMVDAIAIYLYPYVIKHRLTHAQYNIICSKILNLFPNEVAQDYYRYGTRINNLAVRASGKLVAKISNMLSKSPDKTYVRKRKMIELNTPDEAKKARTDDDINAITWLKHYREPWEDVKSKWCQTFHIRQTANCQKVADVIDEWPVLYDPRATSLIEEDFKKLYPDKNPLALLQNWDSFFSKALIIKDLTTIRDPILQDILEELKAEDLTQDSRVALQLCALPRLFPPKGRTKVSKNHWKFSTIESVEGIIIHATSPGDIDIKIQEQKQKALKRKIHTEVQPYLLVEGPDLKNIRNTYIIIDKIHFHIHAGVLSGLDILFKTFFALNIAYPKQSMAYYYAIQKVIFNIDVPAESFAGNISDLLKIKI